MVCDLSLQKIAEEKLNLLGEKFWCSFDQNEEEDENIMQEKEELISLDENTKKSKKEKTIKVFAGINKQQPAVKNTEVEESSICVENKGTVRKRLKHKKGSKKKNGVIDQQQNSAFVNMVASNVPTKLKDENVRNQDEKIKKDIEDFKRAFFINGEVAKEEEVVFKQQEKRKNDVLLKPSKNEMKDFLLGSTCKIWAEHDAKMLDKKIMTKRKNEDDKEVLFNKAVNEIRDMVYPHLDKTQQRQYQQMKNKLLGIKPEKSLKTPYWLLKKQKDSFNKRLAERVAVEKETGVKLHIGKMRSLQEVFRKNKKEERKRRNKRQEKMFENFGGHGKDANENILKISKIFLKKTKN